MKYAIYLILIVFGLNQKLEAQELETKSFRIQITINCEEGNVTCNDVDYIGINKINGEITRLKGKTIHKPCADGVTPCRFLGYEFSQDKISYFIYENGTLEITKIDKSERQVLTLEKGEWKY